MGWFVGRRLCLGTERFDLLVVGFYNLMRGAAFLVLLVGGCSIWRGRWCFFIGVHFLGGFICGGVRLVFVGRRLWLGTKRFGLLVIRFYDLRRGAASLVLSVGGCSICKGGVVLFHWCSFFGWVHVWWCSARVCWQAIVSGH